MIKLNNLGLYTCKEFCVGYTKLTEFSGVQPCQWRHKEWDQIQVWENRRNENYVSTYYSFEGKLPGISILSESCYPDGYCFMNVMKLVSWLKQLQSTISAHTSFHLAVVDNVWHVDKLKLQGKYEYFIPLEKDECTRFNYSIRVCNTSKFIFWVLFLFHILILIFLNTCLVCITILLCIFAYKQNM